ncbi:hypothetical protein [Methylobacterium sp. ARG-1]|uniref:hypothetical protein n=1 Tax=Methylobacterium sp. ARG-1 TaxID=1692501 RepID=UPI000682451F|nr:hypothetical protein [Methylobacterium sp. ARG-1]KNY24628.1 hypothetical protein AKJ13_01385 [Methylobacterium sp. ARG-1]
MRRAIVHIGMPRTGSTAFQEVLARLRPRLDAVGICYPKLAAPGAPDSLDVNHHRLGQGLDRRRPEAERRAGLARLDAILGTTQADTLILSYEDFAVQRSRWRVPEVLAGICARHGFALETALVVKPQAEQLASAYALRTQVVAEGRTFRGFLGVEGTSGRYDYAALLEPWRRASQGRVTAVPFRDRRSDAPLLARLIGDLGLRDRLAPLLTPADLEYRTNRSSGPLAVEAARRLYRLGVHRQVIGHPRQLGHVVDRWAWARGLDADRFRGEAPEGLARVAARYAAANERFAATCWGRPWDAVIAAAPAAPPNELAARPVAPETEALVAAMMRAAMDHVAFRPLPAWRRRAATLLEDVKERLGDVAGYPAWRVP